MQGRFIAWTFGLAPAAMLLLTWEGSTSLLTRLTKQHALPILAVELATIATAVMAGARVRVPLSAKAALAGLLLIAAVTAYHSDLQDRSMLWTFYWIVHLAFGVSVVNMLKANELSDALVGGFLVFIFLFVIRSLSGSVGDWQSNPPGFDQIRRISYYSSVVMAICIGTFATGRNIALYALVSIAASALAFWTGARGALLALLAAGLVGLALFPSFRKLRVAVLTVATGVTGFLVSAAVPVPDAGFMGSSRMLLNQYDMETPYGRWAIWNATISAIFERPLFGWGEGYATVIGNVAHPHNVVLQVLLAWGVIGALLIGILAYLAIRSGVPAVRRSVHLLPLAIAVATLGAYSLVDGTLYHVHAVAIFAACVGVICGSASRDRAVGQSSSEHPGPESSAAAKGVGTWTPTA